MKIVVRADASYRFGSGHVVRCLTLAEELRRNNAAVEFVCREHEGNLTNLINSKGFKVHHLPSLSGVHIKESNYASWMGVTNQKDAEQTLKAFAAARPDWIIVDHYGIDYKWETIIRPNVEKIMVIDDLANRRHDCDVILDQNFYFQDENPYEKLVPNSCKVLLGPQYALLKPEYALYRQKVNRGHSTAINRILVFFGGSDSRNMTSLTLKTLSRPEFVNISVDVVVGINNQNIPEILQLSQKRANTNLITKPLEHLAELMASADLSVGGGGTTTWERICLGLPTIVIALSDNQLSMARKLSKMNYITFLGHAKDISVKNLYLELLNIVKNKDNKNRCEMAISICDGLGAIKVSKKLTQEFS